MAQKNIIDHVLVQSPNRRSMLCKLGLASAALTAAVTSEISLNADPVNPTPVDIIQFALHLDYLEAEFYSVATTGQTLEQRGVDLWDWNFGSDNNTIWCRQFRQQFSVDCNHCPEYCTGRI